MVGKWEYKHYDGVGKEGKRLSDGGWWGTGDPKDFVAVVHDDGAVYARVMGRRCNLASHSCILYCFFMTCGYFSVIKPCAILRLRGAE